MPPYDLDAFAREVTRLIDAPNLAGKLREAGRGWARRYDWEEIATRQEEYYLRATQDATPWRKRTDNRPQTISGKQEAQVSKERVARAGS